MKKILWQVIIILMSMSVLGTNAISQTKTEKVWTEKEAAKWFKKGEWLGGLKLKPHRSIDQLKFAVQYHAHREWWDQAFAYLRETDLDKLQSGKYPIDGENVFATVAEADKKDFDATRWESHQKYQDIQLVITGKEKIGIAPIVTLTIAEPYEDARDVVFYTGKGEAHLAEPGMFFIFFPTDGHRPDIKVEGTPRDKKIVVKVRTE